MPFRHGNTYRALGWLAVACLCFGPALAQEPQEVLPTALESQPETEGGQTTSEEKAADQGQNSEPAPEELSPSLDKIEAAIRDLIAQERAAQGQGPEDHEISDLEAQEGMAFWAKLMFWATVAAVIVTFAGIVLIARTLHHTRRAADYTKGMLEEARKATEAAVAASKSAESAVEVTSEIGKRQLRAYVLLSKPTKIRFEGSGATTATVTLENSGQTPAKNFSMWIAMGVLDHPYHGHIIPVRPSQLSHTPLRPKGKATVDVTETISKEDQASICQSQKGIYISGCATYVDVFGENQTTKFRLMYYGSWGGTSDLSVCPEGNEAT